MRGHTVLAVDQDERRIADLRCGHVPFRAPGLDAVGLTVVAHGRPLTPDRG